MSHTFQDYYIFQWILVKHRVKLGWILVRHRRFDTERWLDNASFQRWFFLLFLSPSLIFHQSALCFKVPVSAWGSDSSAFRFTRIRAFIYSIRNIYYRWWLRAYLWCGTHLMIRYYYCFVQWRRVAIFFPRAPARGSIELLVFGDGCTRWFVITEWCAW